MSESTPTAPRTLADAMLAFARMAERFARQLKPVIEQIVAYFHGIAAQLKRWLPMLAEMRAFQVARRARMRRAYRGRRRAGAWR